MPVNMQEIGCDALFFTGHKMMAYTGIGVLALKHERIKRLDPLSVGGGTIKDVSLTDYTLQGNYEKFEAGTPNIIGAVSLKYALEYIKTLSPQGTLAGGMEQIAEHETMLMHYALAKFQTLKEHIQLIGPRTGNRVALFSFLIKNHPNFNQIGERFAEKNICIRCGGHCAYPLHKQLGI